MNRRLLGMMGERAAEKALIKAGGQVLARNYRVRLGEIDLVVRFGDVIAFVEVKTRSSDAFGAPAEAVDAKKQARIARAAMQFLSENESPDRRVRFDVVEVQNGTVRHIPDAFFVYDSRFF